MKDYILGAAMLVFSFFLGAGMTIAMIKVMDWLAPILDL